MSEPQRILVIETLYLGDLVHTLPLIQALRARYPSAQLDVLVRAPHVALMRHVAGIDEVLAMDPKQHRGIGGLLSLCGQLRKRHYDLVLNPGASDRASILTALSGGRRRIGRLNRTQSRWLWPHLHDAVIDQPWGAEPMYWQKLLAFAGTLGLSQELRFGLVPPPLASGIGPLPPRYIHVSPFASEDIRCLPPATVVALLQGLRRRYPELGLVVSAGPSPREQARLDLIRRQLGMTEVLFLPSTLDLPGLAALVAGAALHIGPDSGPLHLAVALSTPAVGCFLYKDASSEWIPVGARYRTVGVTSRMQGGLYGLPLDALLNEAATLLGIP